MKKLLTAVLVLFVLGSCTKKDATCPYTDSTVVAPASEQQALQDSLTAHGIQATAHPSGFFYTINAQGSGRVISNLCSNLTVTYKGSLFNGNVFDSTSAGAAANFQLGQVILGWQKGMPLINAGGDITLYIPPSLAYGATPRKDNSGNVVIPASSNLIFNVKLLDIQ